MKCLYTLINGKRAGYKCMNDSGYYRYCEPHLKIIGRFKIFFLTQEEKNLYLKLIKINKN